MTILSAGSVVIGLLMLTLGAWKKLNMFAVAVVAAGVVGLLSGNSLIETWEGPFREGLANFASSWMLIFCLGSLFGKLMEDSGAAWRIGNVLARSWGDKGALVAYVTAAAIMIYGGISVFVITFVLVPLARPLFKKADIPWYLFPGITAFATGTFAMTMLPGTLQIQNIIPSKFFGTPLTAAPVAGLASALVCILIGMRYIRGQINRGRMHLEESEGRPPAVGIQELDENELATCAPSLVVSLMPIMVTLICINIFKVNVTYGLLIGVVLCLILFYKSIKQIGQCLNIGFANGILPTVIVAGVVGVGRVIATTPAFFWLKQILVTLPFPGLAKVAAITTIAAGITGSASGGISLGLEIFGKEFLEWGYSPEIIHRVMAISCGGMDTLPWNTLVILLFTLSKVSYGKGYLHVFLLSVLLPLLCVIPAIIISQ